jgi:hypothetical protein
MMTPENSEDADDPNQEDKDIQMAFSPDLLYTPK